MLNKKKKKLELQIDEFLDKVLNGGLLFKQGVRYYLNRIPDMFEKTLEEIDSVENQADALRRLVETQLYMHTLIPEHRGDVLGLLESSDKVLNFAKGTLFQFSVETPYIAEQYVQTFSELTDVSVSAVEAMVSAVRSYFSEMHSVRDYINKTIFFEKESDKFADRLKRTIFQDGELDLARKIHMRYFAHNIEGIADAAEDVCDRLSIAVIKRYG
jgi:hypothetical protein